MPQLSFHPGFNGLVMLAIVAVALVLVAVFYRRAFRSLSLSDWLRLYLLRIAAIVIVLLLLFRPVLSFQQQLIERPSLVFVVDNSSSMSIADESDSGTRLDHARSRLLDWQQKLKKDYDLHVIAFADSASIVEKLEALVDLRADGKATSLSRALAESAKAAPPRDVEAVFLLSDGIHNSAGDPLEAASRLGAPVHTVGVGNVLRDRSSYRDVRVVNLECPDQMAVENRAQLKAYVDGVGLPGRVMKVVFEEDGNPIGEQEVVLDDVDGLQEVTAEFLPMTKGLHTYTARIPAAPEEKIVENNQQVTSALVVDARIRVLYVEGTLRSEYGALVGRFLSKDPNLEFCALVQTRPNVFAQRTNIEDLELNSIPDDPALLDTFDVFLIGDVDSSYFRLEQMEMIQQRVKDGAGLLMVGGYHSLGPGGYGGTPIESVLPVFVGDREIGQSTEPFAPTLTPDGRRHPIFTNITQFFPTKDQEAEVVGLPPLEGCARVQAAKPGATVLMIHPVEIVEGGAAMPVMAVHRVGDGRAAVFTGDTTRNWHQTLRTLEKDSPFLRFWGQTIRWLAGRSEEVTTEAGISATTDKMYYEPESKINISATVRGDEGEGVSGARVTAMIRGPVMNTRLTLAPEAGPAGNYHIVFEPPDAGTYEIEVQAMLDEQTLSAEKLVVNVGRPNLEYERLDLDDKMLQSIASATGGRYAHITTADRLLDRLERRRREREVTFEMALFWPPLLWVIFVVSLTAEWLLRRRCQLR